MKDILPEQVVLWQRVEHEFRTVAERYGFREVRTPLIEHTELFVRQIGEGTDVVEKEMYSFERHSDRLTVRPEGTASAARAYVQHTVYAREPVTRWYYLGPMFRAERPAKGRYRQFFQAGCEHLGDPGPLCDAEMIEMTARLIERFGVQQYAIHVNSLGSGSTHQRYRDALVAYFTPLKAELSEDSQRRLSTNPLRILDSKAKADQDAIAGAPNVLDVLEPPDIEHFEQLRRYLDGLKLPYIVDPKLVRGLDYYTRTLFELKSTSGELGAQDALLGGGRYDNMIGSLGSKSVPAIGFAMGLERILTLLDEPAAPPGPDCYFVPMCDQGRVVALELATALRSLGTYCEVDGRGLSVKALLRRANSLGSKLCLLLGEDELQRAGITVKDLDKRQQQAMPLEGAATAIVEYLRLSGASSESSDEADTDGADG